MQCSSLLRLAKALPGLRVAVRICSEDLLCTSYPDLKCCKRKRDELKKRWRKRDGGLSEPGRGVVDLV